MSQRQWQHHQYRHRHRHRHQQQQFSSTTFLYVFTAVIPLIRCQSYTYDKCLTSSQCKSPRTCQPLINTTIVDNPNEYCLYNSCMCVPSEFYSCASSSECNQDEKCIGDAVTPFTCASVYSTGIQYFSTIESYLSGLSQQFPVCYKGKLEPLVPSIVNIGDSCHNQNRGFCEAYNKDWRCFKTAPILLRAPGKRNIQCCSYKNNQLCSCFPKIATSCSRLKYCPNGSICYKTALSPNMCFSPSSIGQLEYASPSPSASPSTSISSIPSEQQQQPQSPPLSTQEEQEEDHGNTTNPFQPSSSPEQPSSFDTNSTNEGNESQQQVCISLKALASHAVVYNKPTRASVLCDQFDNCATANHLIVYLKQPMAMWQYCRVEPIQCRQSVTLVNSPKYQWNIRIPSNYKQMQYTAHAARFGYRLEIWLLRLVIKLGA